MSKMLGMDPETVRMHAARLQSQMQSLEAAAATIDRVAAASLNPLSYGINPGGLIVAPFAIGVTHSAAAQVRAAVGSVHDLVYQLFDEAREQTQVSSARNASYRHFRYSRAGAPRRPGEAWWKAVPGYAIGLGEAIGKIRSALGVPLKAFSAGYVLKYTREIKGLSTLKDLWNAGAKAAPNWMKVADTFAKSPVGQAASIIGSVASVATAVGTWMDPGSSDWDKTRDTVGAVLAVTGTVLLLAGAGPVALAVAGVAAAGWAIGSAIYDHREDIRDFARGVSSTVSDIASSASKAVGGALENAAGVVKNGFGFVGHAFGW